MAKTPSTTVRIPTVTNDLVIAGAREEGVRAGQYVARCVQVYEWDKARRRRARASILSLLESDPDAAVERMVEEFGPDRIVQEILKDGT